MSSQPNKNCTKNKNKLSKVTSPTNEESRSNKIISLRLVHPKLEKIKQKYSQVKIGFLFSLSPMTSRDAYVHFPTMVQIAISIF